MSAALTTRQHTLDELFWHIDCIAQLADAPAWDRHFALDMARLARRRNWKPSPKQEATMRRIVADRFEADHADFAVIDLGG